MVDPWVLVLGGVAILLATFLAGVVGFAYGLVALPLLLVIGVSLSDVVVINLAMGLITRLSVVARRHRDINRLRTGLLVLGSLPGVGIGLVIRHVVDTDRIQLAAGLFTLLAVAAMVRGVSPEAPSRGARAPVTLTAGMLGGFLGVTTSLNGVPPALLLTGDRASARSMVADLATYFVIGNTVTLVALTQSGQAPSSWVWTALACWIPVGLVGNLSGTALGPRLPYQLFRRLTISVIVVSALVSATQATHLTG
jgi:uncharacterized membrane protein YfcA